MLGQLGCYTKLARDDPPVVIEAGKARFGKELPVPPLITDQSPARRRANAAPWLPARQSAWILPPRRCTPSTK